MSREDRFWGWVEGADSAIKMASRLVFASLCGLVLVVPLIVAASYAPTGALVAIGGAGFLAWVRWLFS